MPAKMGEEKEIIIPLACVEEIRSCLALRS